MIKKLIFIFLLSTQCLSWGWETLQCLEDAFKKADKDTLIVLDIDNTLMRPFQQLGSDEWAYFELKQLIESGLSYENAMKRVDKRWARVQRKTKMVLIEENIDQRIATLQKETIPMIAITTRLPTYSDLTYRQLKRLGINFCVTAPHKEKVEFILSEEVLFQNGILFISQKNKKGEALKYLLKQICYVPKSIIFIDDSKEHVEELEKTFLGTKVSCAAFHYKGVEGIVKAFDPKVAQIQWECFQTILSDETAKKLSSRD